MRSTPHQHPLSRRLSMFALVVITLATIGCESNPVLRQQGLDALAAGDLDRAQNRFTKAIRQDATDWKGKYYLGKVRLEQNRPLEAQLLFERALVLAGDHLAVPDILDYLAESHFIQGNYAAMHDMLQRYSHDRGTTRDYLREARYMLKAGDRDGARVALLKAVKFDPNNPKPHTRLADFYETIGDEPSAIQSLRRAHALAPFDGTIADRLRQYGIVPGPAAALTEDS